MNLLPLGYDSQFNPPVLAECTEVECHSCHQMIVPDFDVMVWLNIGHGLSAEHHAECGADVWAESLDLPFREEEHRYFDPLTSPHIFWPSVTDALVCQCSKGRLDDIHQGHPLMPDTAEARNWAKNLVGA